MQNWVASFGYKFITSYLFSGVLSPEIWVGGHKFCLWTKYPYVVYHHTGSEEEKAVVYIMLGYPKCLHVFAGGKC